MKEEFLVASVDDDEGALLSLAERALERRKRHVGLSKRSYLDTRSIVTIFNMVGSRFSSRAGYAFGDRPRATLPANLEAQMFLYSNYSLWNVNDVSKIV